MAGTLARALAPNPGAARPRGRHTASVADTPPTDLTSLDGTVERVVYRDEASHFTVARFALAITDGTLAPVEPVTVVGEIPGLAEGMPLRLRGRWVADKKWGRQFRIDSFQTRSPETLLGIERFLSSGVIPGIGPELAKRIVKRFGMETLPVIERTPERLVEVEGIGAQRAARLAAAFAETRQMQDVMVFLRGHGVSAAFAARIIKRYGKDAVQVVRENPYRLALEVWGIGFRTADAIAEKLGIARDAPARLEAGLVHVLDTNLEDGHLHVPEDLLLDGGAELLAVDRGRLPGPLASLEAGRHVVREVLGDRGPCLALHAAWQAEVDAATAFAELVRTPARPLSLDLDAAITDFEVKGTIELAPQQRRAVAASLVDKCTVITGGPGVGKTTIIRAVVHLARLLNRKVALAAPTGRAALRLAESTATEASTVHRLLEYQPQSGGFGRNRDNQLEADVVVVDETSMVDISLFGAVLQALRPAAQLVLVGDIDQLPSVGPGAVLGDVIASGAATVVRLTEIFRQAAESAIVVSAHKINQGVLPDLDRPDGASDFYFIGRDDPEAARATVVELVAERIPARFGHDPIHGIQVLTPMHRGDLGTAALNAALQARLNPSQPGAVEIARGDRTFRTGDKVMQLKNDYDKGVFNGDIGVIGSIEGGTGGGFTAVRVDFPDGRTAHYDRNELDQLVHAYAVSVHKSQGSEYPAVVLPLHTQHYMMLQRSLLYTAVTRGKRLVVVVGSRKAVAMAVRNASARQRFTWLAERIREQAS
jgi:exodeoxyribonuclease V alpha subunit